MIGAVEQRGKTMYQCFNCLSMSVIWDNDFDFEDFGLDGDGIVHVCHCTNCGAEIYYYVTLEKGENTDEDFSDR